MGSGVRRIEARTGALADAYVLEQQERLRRLAGMLGATPSEVEARVEALRAELESERRRAQQFERQAGRAEVDTLLSAAEQVDGASAAGVARAGGQRRRDARDGRPAARQAGQRGGRAGRRRRRAPELPGDGVAGPDAAACTRAT